MAMYCQHCGAITNDAARYCAKCGKPVSASAEQARWAPSEGALKATDAPVVHDLAYSGFWRRFGAIVIDGMLLWAAAFLISLAAGVGIVAAAGAGSTAGFASGFVLIACWLLIPWLYFALMESSTHQGTLGKLAVGVMVTDLAGQRIGFGRATGRYWGKIVSQLIMYVGYIMAAFTARKQALHDMMAGTLVVLRNPSPGALATTATARPMGGLVIALIILACMVPVAGILAAIAIPAYSDYTLRAQVSQGLALAAGRKAEVEARLSGSQGPIAETLAKLKLDPLSDTYVASLALESGAIVILYGNQAQARLKGEMLALVPARDGAGRIVWICGYHPAGVGLDLGNPDPAGLTTLPPKYLPSNCRP